MQGSAIERLRAVGKVEGVSFLVLLFIAMPLDRLAGVEEAVSIVGWIHGVLFMLFCTVLWLAKRDCGWTLRQAAVPAAGDVV